MICVIAYSFDFITRNLPQSSVTIQRFSLITKRKENIKQLRSITTPIGSLRVKFNMIMALQGTKNRTIAATNMNATSSRAHTIVAINFTQKTDVCFYSQFLQLLVLLMITLFILYL